MVFANICKLSSKLYGNVVVVASKNNQTWSMIPAAAAAAASCNAQVRGITSKAMRHRNPSVKPEPFPYKEVKYNFWRALLDNTCARFDENSKLIVVDGPPAAGKGALAKLLAEELDMLYIPCPTMDYILINSYGYDCRQLDDQLPEACKSYDEKDFLKNPHSIKASRFNLFKYELRYGKHIEALAHILNTGQGVIMDRSPYSDHIYTNAMAEHGLCSKTFLNFYHQVRDNSMYHLWKPHLVIYLDVPVDEVRRRIEQRNRPYEKDSIVSSPEYLKTLEKFYKNTFLKEINNHSEVLVYDWSEVGDSEVVVEDIERVDFDQYDIYDLKLKDWRRLDKWDWNLQRSKFQPSKSDRLKCFLNVPNSRCPEIVIDGEDYKVFERVWENAPGNKYQKGYNKDMGDGDVLFKW